MTLDGNFANMLRYPAAQPPGVIRLRLHPPTEEAIHGALGWVVSRLAGISIEGKLVVVDGKTRLGAAATRASRQAMLLDESGPCPQGLIGLV